MTTSEHIKVGSDHDLVIVCFGGRALAIGGILPFEFLTFLSKILENDMIFYIDRRQVWYHKGIEGISNNVEETVEYLRNKIDTYKRVIFMGGSAGGYAAILFGSLLEVDDIVAFTPQTMLSSAVDKRYSNLRPYINRKTRYLIYGDPSVSENVDPRHHISHCTNIEGFENVQVVRKNKLVLRKMRDSGELQEIVFKVIGEGAYANTESR